jgi:predicted nucleic acid-binding protein
MEPTLFYLDTCCYGRWQDRQTHAKIIQETGAIADFIDLRHTHSRLIVGSAMVKDELMQDRDAARRAANLKYFIESIDIYKELTLAHFARARDFRKMGLREKDSVHLAVAEAEGVAVLLTVDVDFLKVATNRSLSRVKVINPFTFMGG